MTEDLTVRQSWRGPFWLPSQPDRDQRGVLTYDPNNGITLSLVGGFDDGGRVQLSSGGYAMREVSGRFPVIHGRVGSKPVSLLDCRIVASSSSGIGFELDEQEVRVGRMLTGVFLHDPDAEAFSELTIELENLTRWDHREDIVSHIESDPSFPLGVKWKLAVDPVDPLVVTVDDLTIELGRRYVMPSGDMRREGLDASVFVASYLTIKSAQPKSISQWSEPAKQFQDLLTFAMDTPCAVLSEELTPAEALRNNQQAEVRKGISVYARRINVGDPRAASVGIREAFFTLGEASRV